MADQKKRKFCKLKQMDQSPLIDRKPTHIHGGKLQELLNDKKRLLRQAKEKKDHYNDTNQAKGDLSSVCTPNYVQGNIQNLFVGTDLPKVLFPSASKSYPSFVSDGKCSDSMKGTIREFLRETVKEDILFYEKPTTIDGSISTEPLVETEIVDSNCGRRKSIRLKNVSEESSEIHVPRSTNHMESNNNQCETELVEEYMVAKGKRGPTKMKGVVLNAKDRIEVKFNTKGQAIGNGSISLSSFVGPLVREIVPVTIDDWRKVTPQMKEVLWKSIQVRYKVEKDWERSYIFEQMADLWRASKSRLVKKIKEAPNEEKRLKLRPDNIKSEVEWKAFVREKSSMEFKVKSEKFKEMRKQQLPHTSGRKGYARLIDDMTEDSSMKSPPSIIDVWTKAHRKKNGEPVSSAVSKIIDDIEQQKVNSAASLKDNTLSKVLGAEKSGRLRAYGRGVTKTKLAMFSERDDHIIRLEYESRELKEQMTILQELVETLIKTQGCATQCEERHATLVSSPTKMNGTLLTKKKCKIMDWSGSGEIVAEGRWSSSDPKSLVHHVVLGPNATRIWVDVAIQPDAFLWRPNSEMTTIEEAIGSTIAWPTDKLKF